MLRESQATKKEADVDILEAFALAPERNKAVFMAMVTLHWVSCVACEAGSTTPFASIHGQRLHHRDHLFEWLRWAMPRKGLDEAERCAEAIRRPPDIYI